MYIHTTSPHGQTVMLLIRPKFPFTDFVEQPKRRDKLQEKIKTPELQRLKALFVFASNFSH